MVVAGRRWDRWSRRGAGDCSAEPVRRRRLPAAAYVLATSARS